MRTTLDLDDDLIRRAKAEAVRRGRTLTSLVEDALRLALNRKSTIDREPFEVRPFEGRGLQPGVDLDDNAALLELMEGE